METSLAMMDARATAQLLRQGIPVLMEFPMFVLLFVEMG
jgi:hypothetical protein